MLTVVMPVRNGGSTLSHQFAALSRQVGVCDWELVVVNNRSTDDTAAVISEWAPRFPRAVVIDANDVQGSAAARNRGVRASAGSHLVFCDADDVVDESWIARMGAAAETSSIVAGDVRQLPGAEADGLHAEGVPLGATRFHFLPSVDSANLLVSRELFDVLGGFDERLPYLADVDFGWRAQLSGFELGYASEAIIYKRPRASHGASWVQLYRWARTDPLLFKRFRASGMPPRRIGGAVRLLVSVVARTPLLVMRSQREPWAKRSAILCGRVVGSAQARAWYV